jgi:hypothetical protein
MFFCGDGGIDLVGAPAWTGNDAAAAVGLWVESTNAWLALAPVVFGFMKKAFSFIWDWSGISKQVNEV